MKKIICLVCLTFSTLLFANNSVIATGYGNSENEALKSAYQNAVEQYVGVLIDTKTVIKNFKLIQNDILTFSNGYIDNYKKISSKEQLGLWSVKIEAVIKEQDVLSKMHTLKIEPKQIKNNEQLYAKVVSQVKTKFDAEDMLAALANRLADTEVFYSYVYLNIDSIDVDVDNATRKRVPVTINYSVRLNWKEYRNITDTFERLFEHIGGKKVSSNTLNCRSSNNTQLCQISKPRGVIMPVIVKENEKIVTNIWKFPNSYKTIYPFAYHSAWSDIPVDDRELYSEWQVYYKDKKFIWRPTFTVTVTDNNDNIIWKKGNNEVLADNIDLFSHLNPQGYLNQPRGYNHTHIVSAVGLVAGEEHSVLAKYHSTFYLKFDELKNFKNVAIEWNK